MLLCFPNDILGITKEINLDNWYKDLQDNYCTGILSKEYQLDDEVLKSYTRWPTTKLPEGMVL